MGKDALTRDEVKSICKVLRGTDATTIDSGSVGGDIMAAFPAVEKQISDFTDLIVGSIGGTPLADWFGVTSSSSTLKTIESIFKTNMAEKYHKAISRRQEEAGAGTDLEINDSLFFLPFAASLFELAKELNTTFPRQ